MSWFEILRMVAGGLIGLGALMGVLFFFIDSLVEGYWTRAVGAFIILVIVATTCIWLIGVTSAPTELPVR